MTDHRISPEDVALLRAMRQLISGGASAIGGNPTPAPPMSRRKSSLGRVIDVAWRFPAVNQQTMPILPPLGPQRYGRVEWMPDEPGQLDEEDWLVTAQPLDVLTQDRALPRVFGSTTGVAPFIPRTLGPFQLNPAAWWPYDEEGDSPVSCICDVAGSPFWLVVEGGPEAGAMQRVPIPIVGTCVAVRGRNVAASIEYNPAFAAIGWTSVPFESPVLLEGAGKILVTITKSQPVTRTDTDQMRRVNLRLPSGNTPIQGVTWIPKFTRRVINPSSFEVGSNFEFLDQTGVTIGGGYDRNVVTAVPHNAVAIRIEAGDDPKPVPMTFEVFS